MPARGRRARPARRPRRGAAGGSAGWSVPANPVCTAVDDEPPPRPMSASTGHAFPAARSTPPCASCRRPSARRCSRSTCSAGWSTISPTTARGRARPAPRRSPEWRKDLDALYAGRPAGQASFLQAPVRAFGLKQARFPRRDRRHGNGRRRRHPRARSRDARPLLRPRRRRRRSPLDPRLRHGRGARRRARAPPRPCSAAHQHPARPRRGCRDRPPLPAARAPGAGGNRQGTEPRAVIGDPRVDGACRALAARGARSFRSGGSPAAVQAARPPAGAATDGGRLSRPAAIACWPKAGRRRAGACASAKCSFSISSRAAACSDDRSCHRRRPGRPVGGRRRWPAAACASSSPKRPGRPAAGAAPITMACST